MKTPKSEKKSIFFNPTEIKAKKYKSFLLNKIKEIINNGVFLKGKENRTLIKNLKNYLGSGYITLTASGHDSLFLALKSLKLSPHDEVMFPVNAYPASFPISQSGVTPVPCDVDECGLIDPEETLKKLTNKTRVIVAVHLYGLVCNIDSIKRIIKNRRIVLIEDCAQAFGSTYLEKPAGIFGDISCFSFYPTKNLGTLGDGGMLWTRKEKAHQYFEEAVSYGEKVKNMSLFVSGHSRLPEIQAGVLNVYSRDIYRELEMRTYVFQYYRKLIYEHHLNDYLRILYHNVDSNPRLHLLVLEVKNRDQLQNYLKKAGIETHIHYPYPVHTLPAFSYLKYKKGDFPVAERLSKNILSLPFHPYLTKKQINYIVNSIRNFYLS